MLQHLDLFSGIGGFALACQWAGIETIGFVEIDKYCQKVLKKHWPGVPIVEDIRDVERIKEVAANATELHEYASDHQRSQGKAQVPEPRNCNSQRDIPAANRDNSTQSSAILVTGGVPCQPASAAGKRRGKDDDRWLWPATFDVVRAIQPEWCLFENVTGILTLEQGVVFSDLLSELAGIGYNVETYVIPACAVNAQHRRDRIWIVAHSLRGRKEPWSPGGAFDQSGEAVMGHPINQGCPNRCEDAGRAQRQGEPGGTCQSTGTGNVAKPKSWEPRQQAEPEGGQGAGRRSQEAAANTPINRSTAGFSGQEQGQERNSGESINSSDEGTDWWAVEPELGRVAHGIPHRVDRLKCLGNAIVPQVAYEIIKAIVEIDEGIPHLDYTVERYGTR